MADTSWFSSAMRGSYSAFKEIVLGYPALALAQRLLTWFFFATFFAAFMLIVLPRLDCATNIPNACDWIGRKFYDN